MMPMHPGPAASNRLSVIVRTLGRSTLPRAFGALCAQTFRPTEVVFVDASGTGVEPSSREIPVTVVRDRGRRLDRAKAANAAFAAAHGDWIAFLDEDDDLAPRHYETLFAAIRSTGLPVAYSQTLLVGSDG